MRNLYELTPYRDVEWEIECYGQIGGRDAGCFRFLEQEVELRVIASAGGGWDHLSVSTRDRCPTWEEMECVRKRFALPHEVWMQYGLPDRQHINYHPYCLHWWRPLHRAIKLPPPLFVAP